MRRIGLTAGVVGVALLAPSSAFAGTATLTSSFKQPQFPSSDPAGTYAQVEYAAATGEGNQVTVTASDSLDQIGFPAWIEIHDAGATIEPRGGCAAVDAQTVRCEPPPDGHLEDVSLRLGDGADRLSLTQMPAESRLAQTADGGSGDDDLRVASGAFVLDGGDGADTLASMSPGGGTLTGGADADRLHGGPGDDLLQGDGPSETPSDDLLDGGGGVDTVSYLERRIPLRVDLAAGIGGSDIERDQISAVEHVTGGRAANTLLGDDQPNKLLPGGSPPLDRGNVIVGRGGDDELYGSAATDRLSGGSGDDRLAGGDGNDLLRGGPGDDALTTFDNARVHCGPGLDFARVGSDNRVDGSCERIELLDIVGVPRLLRSRRGLLVRVESQGRRCPVQLVILDGSQPYTGEPPERNLGRTSFTLGYPERRHVAVRFNAFGRRLLARKPRRLLRLALRSHRSCFASPPDPSEFLDDTFLFRMR